MPNSWKDFEQIKELSFENLEIWDKNNGRMVPFLNPPSFADSRGGLGFCTELSSSNVLNHRMKLYELTCDPRNAHYFGQIFGDTYSTEQLIDQNFSHFDTLLDYVKTYGITTRRSFDNAPLFPGSSRKCLTGCPLLKIHDWKVYRKRKRNFGLSEEYDRIMTRDLYYELENYGPAIAYFVCYNDVERFAEDFLYEPNEELGFLKDLKGELSHAVMVVGIGAATHRITKIRKTYFICQHNWGNHGNAIGRMPVKYFEDVICPAFKDHKPLKLFLRDQGLESHAWRRYLLHMRDVDWNGGTSIKHT